MKSTIEFISCALAWAGGREHGELKAAGSQCHSSAALIGLALGIASALSLLGWSLWLLEGRQPITVALALVLAVLGAALFRQLAHASEAAALTAQRISIKLIAALTLLPGAWTSASALPPLLLQSRIDAHAQAVAARAQAQREDAARRAEHIDELRAIVASRQSEADEFQRSKLAGRRALERARGAADKCQNELLFLRLSVPESRGSKQFFEHQALVAECDQLMRAAEQIKSRIEQGVPRKQMAAKDAAGAALRDLGHAERSHSTAAREFLDEDRQSKQPCLPLMNCKMQKAVSPDGVSGLDAWGMTLALLLLGLLPALLLAVLPLDAFARERQLQAVEDALLRAALCDGARKPGLSRK